jgi:hypothetical protein
MEVNLYPNIISALGGMDGRMHVPAVSHPGQSLRRGCWVGLVPVWTGAEDLIYLKLFVVCFLGVITLCGHIFHSPIAGFSLLILEVS